MNLYQEDSVIRCENIACSYNAPCDNPVKFPSDKTTGKNCLWETIKNIWIIAVIALIGTIGLPAILNSPTPGIPSEPSEYIQATPTPSELTAASPTPQENHNPARTTLTGTTNGIEWKYVGNVHNGSPHGNGRKELDNGSYFDGEWSHGRFLNGNGMEISDAGHFVGSFINGFWYEGILQMLPSKATYSGQFIHRNGRNYRHGTGRMEWPNGDWYEGGWRYDNRHGQGVECHAATGILRPGVWINNILQ